MAIDN